jgi:hypothetical protein
VNNNQLGFCTSQNNKQVLIPSGSVASTQESLARNYYDTIYNNTNVFANGQDTVFKNRLRNLVCGLQMPFCGQSAIGTGFTRCYCQDALAACALQDSHTNLFNCSTLPDCQGQKSGSNSVYGVGPISLLITLMMLI